MWGHKGDGREPFRGSGFVITVRSFLVKPAPGAEAVEVEDGVEDEEVAALRLAAPDRVDREHARGCGLRVLASVAHQRSAGRSAL